MQGRQDRQPPLDEQASKLAACPSRISKRSKGERGLQATRIFSTPRPLMLKGGFLASNKKQNKDLRTSC